MAQGIHQGKFLIIEYQWGFFCVRLFVRGRSEWRILESGFTDLS